MRVPFALLGLLLTMACDGEPQKVQPSPVSPGAKTVFAPVVALRSDNITLPPDDQNFGEGAQAALLNSKCTACHSTTMIRYQPRLDRKQWTAIVDKMRDAYRAPIAPGETEAIVDALVALAPHS